MSFNFQLIESCNPFNRVAILYLLGAHGVHVAIKLRLSDLNARSDQKVRNTTCFRDLS